MRKDYKGIYEGINTWTGEKEIGKMIKSEHNIFCIERKENGFLSVQNDSIRKILKKCKWCGETTYLDKKGIETWTVGRRDCKHSFVEIKNLEELGI